MAIKSQRVLTILNFEQRIVAVNRGYFYPAGTILFDVTDVAQDFTFIARLSNPRGKTIVQRRQAGHKGLDIAAGVEVRRQRRLDDNVRQLQFTPGLAGQNQQFTRHIHPG